MRLLSGMTIVLMLAASPAWSQQASPIPVSYAALPAGSALHERQLVRAHLSRTTTEAMLISAPARSVVQIDGQDQVFRRTPDGFAPTPV
jgi:hypothetical protein